MGKLSATQVFINLQRKVFLFNDYFNDHAAKLRIEDSLNMCLQNITAYPFVDPLNRTGNCNETIVRKKSSYMYVILFIRNDVFELYLGAWNV